jgi:hypothetical protein
MQDNAIQQADFTGRLTAPQERAIVALLSHSTIRTAAKAVGIDETTLWRWLQDKEFHAAYMNLRRECVRQSIARLQQASSEAVSTLRTIMKDKEAPASARVVAAKSIIDYSLKAVELEDLAERVAQLESAMDGKR